MHQERATADDELLAERDARRRALTALLALERAQTNHHLAAERDRSAAMIGSRDDFLAMVSHDLRTLLGSIVMSAAALLPSEGDASVQAEIEREARRIQRQVARMTHLVGDLLDVVSIEAGRLAVAPERHDAKNLLDETMDVFRPLLPGAGSLLGSYDCDRILQVLANLLGNAIKFTGEGENIHVVVEAVGDDVLFEVRDNGHTEA